MKYLVLLLALLWYPLFPNISKILVGLVVVVILAEVIVYNKEKRKLW